MAIQFTGGQSDLNLRWLKFYLKCRACFSSLFLSFFFFCFMFLQICLKRGETCYCREHAVRCRLISHISVTLATQTCKMLTLITNGLSRSIFYRRLRIYRLLTFRLPKRKLLCFKLIIITYLLLIYDDNYTWLFFVLFSYPCQPICR